MTVILCLMHLIVSTPHINQESHEYKKVDRKERQVFAVALGLAELFGSLLAPVAVGTAAVAGTAGVIAGAAAIKDKLDHGGSSGGGGSGGGSSGGQQTTALDRTIASVRAMSTTQVKTKLRTLVATATLPGSKYK